MIRLAQLNNSFVHLFDGVRSMKMGRGDVAVNFLRRLDSASAAGPRPVGSILSAVVDHALAGPSVVSRLRAVHVNTVSRWRCGHGRPARG